MRHGPILFCLFVGICSNALGMDLNRTVNQSKDLAPTCPDLMTESECQAHLAIMARIAVLQERDLYLTGVEALLRERVAACRCAMSSVPNAESR